jgi:aryl-alcohol dehydrogenase-like predicted oxidoreductase
MRKQITRRDFVSAGSLAAGSVIVGVGGANAAEYDRSKILNYNENMEYRRLGNTGLMVSAVCLGGHWKRMSPALNRPFSSAGMGISKEAFDAIKAPDFMQNRHEVVSRCIEVGINYVDACTAPEIVAYSRGLRGRRDKMYFGYSWPFREPRHEEWRSTTKLVEGLNQGLKEAGLDYVDLWRISMPMEGIADLGELRRVEEATVRGLEEAKKQGKTRFTGVSTHNRIWLKSMIEQYPKQMEVVLFPYTAATKELPNDSVFGAIRKHDVGTFGIKPFADNSLFVGDSSPNSPHAEEDDRRARMAIRYILGNPAITAPIPGLITPHQVDNVAKAIQERRELDLKEKAELETISKYMWANLSPGYQWLRDWEYV